MFDGRTLKKASELGEVANSCRDEESLEDGLVHTISVVHDTVQIVYERQIHSNLLNKKIMEAGQYCITLIP